MAFCSSCGTALEATDRFCGNCGAAVTKAEPAALDASTLEPDEAAAIAPRSINTRRIVLGSLFGAALWGVIFFFIFSSDGCSSTEGSLHAEGEPLGDFEFVPAQCKSGEHESFFGVYLLGDNSDAGGVKIVVDPRAGKFLQVEVPGSCRGSDDCKVVDIEPTMCKVFDVSVEHTNTTVNDIRLLDGHMKLSCQFAEGGSATADVTFESCD